MRSTKATTSALTLLVALTVAACGGGDDGAATGSPAAGKPTKGGSVVVSTHAPFSSWDGTATFDSTQDARLDPLVCEGLVRQGMDEGIEPALAEKWEYSNDNKTITFTLRDGIEFSNGRPVTAADVVWSYDKGWMAEDNINGASYLKYLKDAEAVDEKTVVFTSERPNGQLPYALSYGVFGVYPEGWLGKTKDAFMKSPTCVGPFLPGKVKPGSDGWDEVTVNRNPVYYGEPAKLDSITFRYLADPNQQALQFKSGAVDLVRKVDTGLVDRYDPGTVHYIPQAEVHHIFTSWSSKPWVSQAKFRRAISLAIDREKLLKGYWNGHGRVATHVAPEELKDSPPPPNGDWSAFDPDEAKRLLAEIGYDGEEVPYDVLATDQGQKILTQAIAEMLRAVGINIKILTSPDYNSYLVRLAGQDGHGGPYSLANGYITGSYPHPGEVLASFADYAWFGVGAPTDVAQKFRLEVIAAATPDEARTAMERMEQWAYDNTVMVPLAQPDFIAAIQPKLQGFRQNLVGMWRPEEWYLTQ